MGCFNMKCALTQLPVTYGDPVVVLLGVRPGQKEQRLVQSGGFMYQPHYFNLITTPLYGVYNDYGWVEDVEEASNAAATAFLRAVGYGDAIDEGLNGEHWNDCLDAFTNVVYENNPEDMNASVGYTFIHRKAWDKLLATGRQRQLRLYESVTMDDAEAETWVVRLLAHQVRAASYARYDNRAQVQLSGHATPAQLFALATEMLPKELPQATLPTAPDVTGLSQEEEEAAVLRQAMKDLQSQMKQVLSDLERKDIVTWLSAYFSWLRPLFTKDIYGMEKVPQREVLRQVITLANQNPALYQALEDTNTMFLALNANQLVIRAHDDLPSQSQDTSYWGQIALIRAAAEVVYRAAEKRQQTAKEDDDDDSTYPHDITDVVEALVQDELKRDY